jgi:hypothetical protein
MIVSAQYEYLHLCLTGTYGQAEAGSMVAIYKGTKTLVNVQQQRRMVLQVLSTGLISA